MMTTIKDRFKKFRRASARHGLFISTWIFNKLPYSMVKFLASCFIFIGYQLIIKQKKIAFESLNIAFGDEKSPEEIKHIAKSCFVNLGRAMAELIYFMDHPRMIKENVYFENKHHLDEAFKQNKGVIVVSAHFGSFPLMLLRCAQEGYKANAIIRPARDEIIEKYFLEQRSKLGLNTVYSHQRKKCVDTSIKVLRNNELLFIPLDQNFGSSGGVFVDFFGQKAATATGPIVFAKRTGAPIVPMFIVREGDQHKIIVESPLQLEEREDDKEELLVNTEKITKLIEQYVRKFPQEWGWMHRRWKSRPKNEKPAMAGKS